MSGLNATTCDSRINAKSLSFQLGQPIGCTSLSRLASKSLPFLGKFIPKAKLHEFIACEGRIYSTLAAAPHPSLPKVIACVDSVGCFDGRLSESPKTAPADAKTGGDGSAIIFPEYYSDLHSVVSRHEKLSEDVARSYFRQLISAVAHCHRRRIVLGDIKLGKIMFADKDLTQILFADLGGAIFMPGFGQPLYCRTMSPAYVAPEVVAPAGSASAICPPALDMWAMGVVLFVMLTGVYPFSSLSPSILREKILAARFVFPTWVTPAARRLISRMLSQDPSLRPSAAEVLADPWLLGDGVRVATKRASDASAEELREALHADDQVVPVPGCSAGAASALPASMRSRRRYATSDEHPLNRARGTAADADAALAAAAAQQRSIALWAAATVGGGESSGSETLDGSQSGSGDEAGERD